jgi:hypothetical protein
VDSSKGDIVSVVTGLEEESVELTSRGDVSSSVGESGLNAKLESK